MAGGTTGAAAALIWFLSNAPALAQENCCNRIDDDGDGKIDFRDEDCATAPDCPIPFRRGDVDLDGKINITDAIILLQLAFGGLPDRHSCDEARDVNDDGSLDVTDAIVLIDWLFRSGPVLPEPFLECGLDRTPDALLCLMVTFGC
jgi:dockerin type I repeat protein